MDKSWVSIDKTNIIEIRIMKRYFKIDQHLARHFDYYIECLSRPPPPFLYSHIITPFINSMISNNQEKRLDFLPIVKPLYPYSSSSVEFLLNSVCGQM